MKLSTRNYIYQQSHAVIVIVLLSVFLVITLPCFHLLYQTIFTTIDIDAIKFSMADGEYTPIIIVTFAAVSLIIEESNKKKQKVSANHE
jgi:hypothetical protein